MTPEQREQIRALAHDLPALWHASTTTDTERKHLLRFLIKDVTLSQRDKSICIALRWQTEAQTLLSLPKLQKSWEVRQTSPEVIERIREWASLYPDSTIATLLNEAGYRAGLGGSFTASKVQGLRYAYEIETGCPIRPSLCPSGQRTDGRYSAQGAAQLLNVHVSTIAEWCKAGRLESLQASPRSPRWITLTPEIIAALRQPTQRRWKQHS